MFIEREQWYRPPKTGAEPMDTPFRIWRRSLGLTQENAADTLFVDVRTVQRYDAGERTVPAPTAFLTTAAVDRMGLTKSRHGKVEGDGTSSDPPHTIRFSKFTTSLSSKCLPLNIHWKTGETCAMEDHSASVPEVINNSHII